MLTIHAPRYAPIIASVRYTHLPQSSRLPIPPPLILNGMPNGIRTRTGVGRQGGDRTHDVSNVTVFKTVVSQPAAPLADILVYRILVNLSFKEDVEFGIVELMYEPYYNYRPYLINLRTITLVGHLDFYVKLQQNLH